MGLFDGVGPAGDRASSAEPATFLDWPVVLVVDASAQAGSIGAVVRGFATHREETRLAGVILNRVGSPAHEKMLRAAVAAVGVPVLGALRHDGSLALPERHLGLVPAAEHGALEGFIERAADLAEASVNLKSLLMLADGREFGAGDASAPVPPLAQRIAVAKDVAFSFAYPHVLDGWRRAGAELSFFSPLADEAPDAAADAVFLPGGYPELHAGKLAAAGRFLDGVRRAKRAYGECGGYMVLGEGLADAKGERHAMAGLLPLVTSFKERRLHLGYRMVRGRMGAFRGHEFHYATILQEGPGDRLFSAWDAEGRQLDPVGLVAGNASGSFVHLVDRVTPSARA
jgi:cobyrinic acid a,c-diamide synthase